MRKIRYNISLFDYINNNPDDTLAAAFLLVSTWVVTNVDGDTCLASSDIDSDRPYRRGALIQATSKIKMRTLMYQSKKKKKKIGEVNFST
jgi:hypothetical protein